MNAVVVATLLMLVLSFSGVPVIIALTLAALLAGVVGGLTLEQTFTVFESGLSGGAEIAMGYAWLGVFAVAVARSGLVDALVQKVMALARSRPPERLREVRWVVLCMILVIAVSSQSILPLHIAFVPVLLPALLYLFGMLRIDRRLVACIITFGLAAPYTFLPVGFGRLYFSDFLLPSMQQLGLDASEVNHAQAVMFPVGGMMLGLLIAGLFTYRKRRDYDLESARRAAPPPVVYRRATLLVGTLAVVVAFAVHLWSNSIIIGSLAGFVVFSTSGVIEWKRADGLFTEGMKMLAMICCVLITASGFAQVMIATGDLSELVHSVAEWIDGRRGLAALVMLLTGLVLTIGIGSVFATIPVVVATFVPLCLQLGFSGAATVSLIATVSAMGDVSSPASDTTLAVSAGLGQDGQHSHVRDTVLPNFLHFNLPLLVFGWVGAVML